MRQRLYEDGRTDEQRARLHLAVVMTDAFMSEWGGAEGGMSYAAWACAEEHLDAVEAWVSSRREARRVRIVDLRSWRPRAAHTHIYPVDAPSHPALRGAICPHCGTPGQRTGHQSCTSPQEVLP